MGGSRHPPRFSKKPLHPLHVLQGLETLGILEGVTRDKSETNWERPVTTGVLDFLKRGAQDLTTEDMPGP